MARLFKEFGIRIGSSSCNIKVKCRMVNDREKVLNMIMQDLLGIVVVGERMNILVKVRFIMKLLENILLRLTLPTWMKFEMAGQSTQDLSKKAKKLVKEPLFSTMATESKEFGTKTSSMALDPT
jgi:hypothetical protein